MPRDWTPRESRLVAEWATQTYPTADIRFRVSLGAGRPALEDPTLSDAELRQIGVKRRWVDAMIVEPRTVHLVEAKIRLTPGGLEQLELYRHLFPLTPELANLRGRELQLHLVMAIPDPVLVTIARSRGVQVHVFKPAWVDEYLALLNPRERRAPAPDGLADLFPPGGDSET